VKTAFVCEVAFAEWTLDGELRQTTFLGWRTIRIQRKWYWSKPEKAEIRKWRSRKPSSRENLQNLFPASALVCRGSLSERDCSKRRTLCVGYSQFFYVSLRILDPDVFLCTLSQWVRFLKRFGRYDSLSSPGKWNSENRYGKKPASIRVARIPSGTSSEANASVKASTANLVAREAVSENYHSRASPLDVRSSDACTQY